MQHSYLVRGELRSREIFLGFPVAGLLAFLDTTSSDARITGETCVVKIIVSIRFNCKISLVREKLNLRRSNTATTSIIPEYY